MARTIPGTIDLTADGHLAICVQVTDRLGNVQGFTEHDNPITRDISDGNGEVTYNPEASFARSATEARSGGRVGSTDLIGFLDSAGITEEKVFAQFYDSALVRFFLTDWTQTAASSGIIWIEIGELEQTQIEGDKLSVTFKSLLDRYHSIKLGDLYETTCIHILGSQPEDIPPPFGSIGCRVQLNPPTWTANTDVLKRDDRNARPTGFETSGSPTQMNTVQPADLATVGRFLEAQNGGTTGGSEPAWGALPALGATFNDNGVTWIARQELRMPVGLVSTSDQSNMVVSYTGDAPNQWYRRGRIVCTSGANVGVGRHIKSAAYPSPNDGTLLITTWLPFPLALDAGSPNDLFVLETGCDHQATTCIFKFRNFRNWGGFAIYAPVNDEVFAIPKQSS